MRLTVRRFRCGNLDCPAVTFVEQVPDLTLRWARRTDPVTAMLAQIGLVLAGRAGARLAEGLGAGVGRGVLLRVVRSLPVPDVRRDVRVLGVDDFALRRGHVYGTVLIDLDTHRPIDLLPERTAEPVAEWLRGCPVVETVCRDRAGAYAQAAIEAAPAAVQVADRWHLWHNLAQHVERAVAAHRGCWSARSSPAAAPAAAEVVQMVQTPATVEAATAVCEPPPTPSPSSVPADRSGGGRLATRARERWQLIHDLREQGLSLRQITRETGLSRGTVRRFARAADPAEFDRGPRPGRGSSLDAHREFLVRAWLSGNTNAARLHVLLRARGYRGSSSYLRQYVHDWRDALPSVESIDGRDTASPSTSTTKAARMSTRAVTRWICTRSADLTNGEQKGLATALERCEHLDRLAGHVRDFAVMLTHLAGEHLNDWIHAVQQDTGQPQLMSFVRGLLADYDAVRAGLTLKHSSGPVEGNVNRIKMIKRKMYGRANFDLLRVLVVLGP